MDTEIVVDSSSVLAFLLRERGGENFPAYLRISLMSVVNYAEVVQRLLRDDPGGEQYAQALLAAGMRLIDADIEAARAAAALEKSTRLQGVSLADRFCLSLAMQRRCPVLTADRSWKLLGLAVEIRLLR